MGALCQRPLLPLDFDSFFLEALSQFDVQPDEFSPPRVQDELIGQMSELLGIDYDVLALDLTESESRHRALVSDPTPPSAPPALPEPGAIARPPIEPAPPPLQLHLLRATLPTRRQGPGRWGPERGIRSQPCGSEWRSA